MGSGTDVPGAIPDDEGADLQIKARCSYGGPKGSLHVANEFEDLHSMRTELQGPIRKKRLVRLLPQHPLPEQPINLLYPFPPRPVHHCQDIPRLLPKLCPADLSDV